MELPEFANPRPESMRVLRLQLSALVIVYTLAVYTGMYFLTRTLVFDSLRAQGESYFALVVDMRAWNAARGAVWVPKTAETATNPFLEKLGIQADIRTEDGTLLTMRNPSAMTREVSDLTRQRSGVSFHLTSLDYLNPANAPDPWENNALEGFADGELARYGVDEIGGVRYFRYAAPLRVDTSCLGCHGQQDYSVGDERGAITVSIPMAGTDDVLLRAAAFLTGMSVLTLAGALVTLHVLASRAERRVATANEQLTRIALTDALTGLLNRGATFARLEQEFVRARRTGTDLGVVMLDIDHFKQVNDTYGHGIGDCTLRTFALRVTDAVRAYDVVGRIGGEEFLVIAPGADEATTLGLAERILERVRASQIACGPGLAITTSAGITTLAPDDPDIDTLVHRSDDALYAAKRAGRDGVASASDSRHAR